MTRISIVLKKPPATKQCLCCRKKFIPRVGQHQKYCSNRACQTKRKRKNRRAWQADPENQKFRQAQQRKWRKSHPEYMNQWRKDHPESVDQNRKMTKVRMKRIRRRVMFEKSNQSIAQAVGNKCDVLTNLYGTIIFMRLKRGSALSKSWSDRYACKRTRSARIRMPQGRLYRVTAAL